MFIVGNPRLAIEQCKAGAGGLIRKKRILVELFNNLELARMATVNFSVPEDVKRKFNAAFGGENKSAVLTRLMRKAIEERHRAKRRAAAIDAVLKLRRRQAPVTDREVRKARGMGRP